jgi:hypothetical protein
MPWMAKCYGKANAPDPYQKGGSTAACVASFGDYVAGRNATASEYRAMLNRCQDVNPCNTFLGFGYSQDYADYLATLPGQHYAYSNSFTGAEFVVRNIDMRSMMNGRQAAFIHLPAPANSGARPCRGGVRPASVGRMGQRA